MFGLGTPEIILIAIVILVLFGAKKIPDLMQGLGKGIKEFKKASGDIKDDITGNNYNGNNNPPNNYTGNNPGNNNPGNFTGHNYTGNNPANNNDNDKKPAA